MPHETDDLEPQQYARHYIEDDVPLKDVRSSTLRRSVYIGLVLFAVILAAGATIRFPDEVSLPFVLRGGMPERIYRFPYPVYVEQLYARPGVRVGRGAPLARITSPEIVSLISRYRAAESALENYRRNKPQALADTRDIVRLQAAQNAHLLEEIRQRQSALESTWKSNEARLRFELEEAGRRLSQSQALYSSKHISALELKEYETARLRAADALTTASESHRRDAAALREDAARYSLQNVSLSREEDRNLSEARADSTALLDALAQAGAAIRHSFGDFSIEDGSLLLRAEEGGVLSFLFEGEREVPQSAILLKLTPAESGLYATAVSPPSLIGKLKPGQTAYLKVSTFPSYEWGAARGHVEGLSLTPDEKGVFNVRIAMDDERRLAARLQPGMDGVMAVQLEERTFFQYFFRHLRHTAAAVSGNE